MTSAKRRIRTWEWIPPPQISSPLCCRVCQYIPRWITRLGGSVKGLSDSWPGSCEYDTQSKQTSFPTYFRLSPLKHVRKVVGGFEKKVVLVLQWESQKRHVRHRLPWYDLSCWIGVKGSYLDFSHLTELKNMCITEIYMRKQYKSSITKNREIRKKKKKWCSLKRLRSHLSDL